MTITRSAQRLLFLAITMLVCIAVIVAMPRPAARGERALPPVLLTQFPPVSSNTSEPGLPFDWHAAWSASVRDSTISHTARAFRIGAHFADLDLVAEARRRDATWQAYYGIDTMAVARGATNSAYVAAFAHEIVASLAAMPDGRRRVGAFRRLEQRGRDRATISSTDLERARADLPPEQMAAIAIGNWLEGARIAAYRGDTAFFKEARSRAMAIHAVYADAARPARHTLQQLRAAIMAPERLDLAAAGRAATSALRVLAEDRAQGI